MFFSLMMMYGNSSAHELEEYRPTQHQRREACKMKIVMIFSGIFASTSLTHYHRMSVELPIFHPWERQRPYRHPVSVEIFLAMEGLEKAVFADKGIRPPKCGVGISRAGTVHRLGQILHRQLCMRDLVSGDRIRN
jgi:hypothetical protein